jgi:xylulokinase
MSILAIDAGTTVIKAVLFSESGAEIATATQRTRVKNDYRAWSEQDMHQVMRSVKEACLEAIKGHESDVSAISITAQGDGAWIIDEEGKPLRPAILWNDGRASTQVGKLLEKPESGQIWSINGSAISLGLPNSIMMWLAENEPDVLSKAQSVLSCGSWIFFSLTGRIGQEISDASAPWLNIQNGEVSGRLLELYGLDNYAHLIPPILEQSHSPLLADVAQSWGLPKNIPVVLAPYDVVSTATGSGCLQQGDALAILGTTICPGIISEKPTLDGVQTGLNLLGAGEGQQKVLRAFPTVTGVNTLDWLAGLIQLPGAGDVAKLSAESKTGANGVLWLPYLSESGERAPFFNPDASGLLFGVTQRHGREDLARGLLESLSYVIRESLEESGELTSTLSLSGGAAQSDLWCQIIADVTSLTVSRTEDQQVGAKGAFLYASVAVGIYESLDSAAKTCLNPGATFEPNEQYKKIHDQRFELFRDLRRKIEPSWSRPRGIESNE